MPSFALQPRHNALDYAWVIAAGVHFATMTTVIGRNMKSQKIPARCAAAAGFRGDPVVDFAQGMLMCTTNIVEWRGTHYSHKMAEKLAVK